MVDIMQIESSSGKTKQEGIGDEIAILREKIEGSTNDYDKEKWWFQLNRAEKSLKRLFRQ